MASPRIGNLNFPYFPYPPYHPFWPPPPVAKPPPPPSHPLTPPPHVQPPPPPPYHPAAPPPHARPPPTPHVHPPPPPSHPSAPPPHIQPQPPSHPFAPPPPHVRPVPPPSPSPDNHPTVIVIVFISLGGLFFLAFLAAALFCFINKRKKKTVEETDIIHVDEHRTIKEAIIPGPHGPRAVVLSIDDDIHIDEVIRKNEKFGTEGLHAKSAEGKSGTLDQEGATSSGIDHHHHHHLEHKS